MVQAAYRYSRFLFVESCGQCPPCKFGIGEVTQTVGALEAGGGSAPDLELILVRARGSTGGQKCVLPTGESLLMQSLVQGFQAEFASHIAGRVRCPASSLPQPVDWDATAARFAYDLAYADKQPD
jgi:NADH-quinone oxidoreductase subunit F